MKAPLWLLSGVCLAAIGFPAVSGAAKPWPIDLDDIPKEDAVCFCLYTVHRGTLKMTAHFRVDEWDATRAWEYRVVAAGGAAKYRGRSRKIRSTRRR